MDFESELAEVLPADLPHRARVIALAAGHLAMIVEANRTMNLTRILSPREAAIKHVLDSVLPWRLFADAAHVLDAGTGAGYPGLPLALVLPGIRFTLAESTQKKARFVEAVVAKLELANVTVSSRRAEELALNDGAELIATRALAPIAKTLDLFAPALKRGVRALLYKGPDVGPEIALAEKSAARLRVRVSVVMRYDLPEAMGSRTIVELTSGAASAS